MCAPVPKEVDEKFQKDVAAAREKAIKHLKSLQNPQGNWEGLALVYLADMDGGCTALVTLAMLEAGVPADDPAVKKALDYLAALPPRKTYVVSLQTQALAKADAKKYAVQIQKNADWQIWIEEKEPIVPRKILITYKNQPGAPQYTAVFTAWDLRPSFREGQFKPVLPKGAQRIDFLKVKEARR